MTDLRTQYLGLALRSPIVASSSPLTAETSSLRQLEDAGVAAVVLPSLFEEQIEAESLEVDRWFETGSESFAEALSYFPALGDYDTGPDHYLELVHQAKQTLGIPVIGSLNGVSPGGWIDHARLIEQAGADALELNLYLVAADPATSAQSIEADHRELVASMAASVEIPIAVKLGPFFTAFAHTARELVGAGASGLVLFNRFYQPDLDLERFDVVPRLSLSTPEELHVPLRWIGLLHGQIDCSLALTTGVHGAEGVAKALLAGADVAMMASALLQYGPAHVQRVERRLVEWMEQHETHSVSQLRGSVSQRSVADPAAYERANYVRTLRSYSSRFRG